MKPLDAGTPEAQLPLGLKRVCGIPSNPRSEVAVLDQEQRDLLLLGHLPQVRFIARKIHGRLPQQVLLEDLIHAGVLGLMDAIKKYDPAKKVQLKHYAEFRIRGAIVDSLRQVDWSPRALRIQGRRLSKAVADCRAQLGRDPSEPEIAIALKITLCQLQRLLGDLHGLDVTSLQPDADQLGANGKAICRSGREDQDPYHQTLRSEMQGLLTGAFDQLPIREQEVLALYDFDELTMKEVAIAMGIGESRVSQIHSSAMIHLRERLFQRLRPGSGPPQLSIMPIPIQQRIRHKTLVHHVIPANDCAQKLAG
jgi:RNA polymerase sigma factor for flagellar operon FliA